MTSFYIVARGSYTPATVNADEIWQYGIRYWWDGSVPDQVGEFPDIAINPVSDFGALTGGNYDTNWDTPGMNMVGMAQQFLDAFDEFHGSTWVAPATRLEEIRFYPIDETGHVVVTDFGAARMVITPTSPIPGGGPATLLPLEVAEVITFRTSRSGPRGRGRIYQPPSTLSAVTSDGRLQPTYCEDRAEEAATLLAAIAVESVAPTDPHGRPVVTGPSAWNTYAVITSVEVGDVPDAQRRRRNRLVEARTSEPVTYG